MGLLERLRKKWGRKGARDARESAEGGIYISEEAWKWDSMIAHDPVYHAAIIREIIIELDPIEMMKKLGYIP